MQVEPIAAIDVLHVVSTKRRQTGTRLIERKDLQVRSRRAKREKCVDVLHPGWGDAVDPVPRRPAGVGRLERPARTTGVRRQALRSRRRSARLAAQDRTRIRQEQTSGGLYRLAVE